MESLRDLAARLDAAAESLADVGTALGRLAIEGPSFAADAPGGVGEVGRSLHAQWAAALAARSREAAAAGARLEDTAQTIRIIAAGYQDVDESTGRREQRGA